MRKSRFTTEQITGDNRFSTTHIPTPLHLPRRGWGIGGVSHYPPTIYVESQKLLHAS